MCVFTFESLFFFFLVGIYTIIQDQLFSAIRIYMRLNVTYERTFQAVP